MPDDFVPHRVTPDETAWVVINVADPVWLLRVAQALYAFDSTGDTAALPWDLMGVPAQGQYLAAAVYVLAALTGVYER